MAPRGRRWLAALALLLSAHPGSAAGITGRLRLALLADLHYGEAENQPQGWGRRADDNTTAMVDRMVRQHKPTLGVLLGDVVTANNVWNNATDVWMDACKALVENGVPWFSVMGNHDDAPLQACCADRQACGTHECGFCCGPPGAGMPDHSHNRKTLLEAERAMYPELARTPRAQRNYRLEFGAGGNRVVAAYVLDTGGGSMPEQVTRSQASFVREAAAAARRRKRVEVVASIAFAHIPLPAFARAAREGRCFGSLHAEDVASVKDDAGARDLWRALVEDAGVSVVFSGHNHGNDWCCATGGAYACYARHAGFGGYGPWERGVRFVDVAVSNATGTASAAVTTFVALAGGAVVAAGTIPLALPAADMEAR